MPAQFPDLVVLDGMTDRATPCGHFSIEMTHQADQFQPVLRTQLQPQASTPVVLLIADIARRCIVIFLVRDQHEAAALLGRGSHGVIKNPLAAAQISVNPMGAQAACRQAQLQLGLGIALEGEDLDHATDGVRAVHRAGWAFDDFDPFDFAQRDRFPRRAAGRLRIDANAVDQHQAVTRFCTPDIEKTDRTGAAIAGHFDGAAITQQIVNAAKSLTLDVDSGDDGDVGQQLAEFQR